MLFAATLCVSSINIGETGAAVGDDEYAFKCGALYGLLEQVHIRLGEEEKSRLYGTKFQNLGSEVEKLFEDSESGKIEASNRMKTYIDEMIQLAVADKNMIRVFTEICDEGYVSFPGLP